jgi:2-iminobutanoate/2-iminopropanoate deaminase
MLTKHNPKSVAPPLSRYTHGVEAPAGARWLYVSGQVGVGPDGKLAEDPRGQIENAFQNLMNVLAAAGMGPHDLVKVNVFLTRREDLQALREVRERHFQGAEPASTLLYISGLARPEFVVEVEAVAAKA